MKLKNILKKVIAFISFLDDKITQFFRYLKGPYSKNKQFLYHQKSAIDEYDVSMSFKKLLLIILVINILIFLILHVFVTYIIDQPEAYFISTIDYVFSFLKGNMADSLQDYISFLNEQVSKYLPVYPYGLSKNILLAPFIYLIFFFIKTIFLHIGILPQKAKGNLKTTFKISAYSELAKTYMLFLALFIVLSKIGTMTYEAMTSLTYILLIFLGGAYLITKIVIIIAGCMKLHKLEEHEATFAAFFPLFMYMVIIVLGYVVFSIITKEPPPA